MKAISIWQPWASAIAIGTKKIETRGWRTNYRGSLLIHAAKKRTYADDNAYRKMAGIAQSVVLPLGALVAVVELVDCCSVETLTNLTHRERSLGNYDNGRFGWILKNVRAMPEPIPYCGRQGVFNVPDSVLPEEFRSVQE